MAILPPMKTFIAISMIVLALGLAACGDDNDHSAQDTAAQTPATGTKTGTTTGTTTSKEDRKAKRRESSSKRSSGSDSKSDTSRKRRTTNSGKGTATTPSSRDRNKNAGKAPLYTEKEAEDLSSQLVAKRVCQGFLPTETEAELKKNKTTYEAIAKNYAKGWPASKRDEAYKGCLAGLKARKVKK